MLNLMFVVYNSALPPPGSLCAPISGSRFSLRTPNLLCVDSCRYAAECLLLHPHLTSCSSRKTIGQPTTLGYELGIAPSLLAPSEFMPNQGSFLCAPPGSISLPSRIKPLPPSLPCCREERKFPRRPAASNQS
jgi:hypothetical protein